MTRTTLKKHRLNTGRFDWLVQRLFLIFVFSLSCQTAFGQSEEVNLTSGGFTVVEGHLPGTPPSLQPPIGSPLSGANLSFGELAAVSGLPRRVVIKMPIRISAVKPYKVEMEIAPVANEVLQLSDIGFGIENIRPQPSADSNRTDTATTVSIAGGSLLSNPATVKVFKGVPLFDATLANIPSVILTGLPTVAAGKLGDDSNSILIDLKFVIVEQYFTPNSFNFSLTLKISPIN